MPAPAIVWYDDGDVAESAALTFAPVNGIATAAQEVHVWNDKGTAINSDTATMFTITAYARDTGGAAFSQDDEAAASGWIEARAIGSAGTGIVDQTTPWTPIGKSMFLALYDVPKNCTRYIEVRINIPAGFGTEAKDVLLRARWAGAAQAMPTGTYEAGAQGIVSGVGDGLATWLCSGGALTASGTPDDKVNLDDVLIGLLAGQPACTLPEAITINGTDGASASLTSGKSYWVALSQAADGSIVQTKGVMGTSPLTVTARPTPLPNTIAFVEREYDGTIESGDIYDVRAFGAYLLTTSTGSLTGTLSAGQALLGNSLVRHTGTQAATFVGSDTNYLWLRPDGTLTVNQTGAAPVERALLLWEADTNGSGVTAVRDRREYLGRQVVVIQFQKSGTLAGGDYIYSVQPGNHAKIIRPYPGSVVFAVGSLGATSGSTKLDIEKSVGGAAFASLWPSSGTYDGRPDIAYNASDPASRASLPEEFDLEAGCRLRAKVVNVPGTASSDLTGVLLAEIS
jgi:hypothetical protein